MELGRNVTLGRYIPGDSFVHGMDPRLKLCAWGVFAVGLFLPGSFSAMLVMTLALAVIVAVSDVPVGYLLRGLRPMLPFLLFIYVFQLLFSRSLYAESTNIWWSWGIFAVTGEGATRSTLVIIRVVLLYLSVTTLTLTTTIMSLVDALERMSSPFRRIGVPNQELALAFAIAIRFVPGLVQEAEKLMKAQASRGASMDVGGPVRRIRARLPVLVPLIVGTLARSHDLTSAMHARCYRGGEGRTKRREVTATFSDWAALAAMVALMVLVLSMRFALGLP